MNAYKEIDISQMEKDQDERIQTNLDLYEKIIAQLDDIKLYELKFDRIFMQSRYKLINSLSEVFDKITPEIIGIILKNCINKNMYIKEILNFLFSINQMIYFIEFFQSNVINLRTFKNNTIENYYALDNEDFTYIFKNYKVVPAGEDTSDDIMGYRDSSDLRRVLKMDDSCMIIY
jgi:hypothetical protein